MAGTGMEGYAVERVEYKEGLDLHFVFPRNMDDLESVPLVLFYPGGGWIMVDPKMHYVHCYFIAAALGLPACTVQYSTEGLSGLQTIMDDCISALQFCKSSHRYSKKFGQICVMGNSAGGQIAMALILCHKGSATAYPKPDSAIVFAPALDLERIVKGFIRPKTEEEEKALVEQTKAWNPIAHIGLDADTPLTTILHGTDDTVVDVENTRRFVQKCHDANIQTRYVELQGYGHTDFYVNNPWAKFHKPAQDRANARSSEKSRGEAFDSPDNVFIQSIEHMQAHLIESGMYKGSPLDRSEILKVVTSLTESHFR